MPEHRADQIGGVVEVEERIFAPPPEILRGSVRTMILGVHKLSDRLMRMLDIQQRVPNDGGHGRTTAGAISTSRGEDVVVRESVGGPRIR